LAAYLLTLRHGGITRHGAIARARDWAGLRNKMKIIKTLIIVIGFVAAALAPAFAQTECNDGSYSNSSGRGTCSHHGGEQGN